MACPLCKSQQFYVKDPDDIFETYDFELQNGQLTFGDPQSAPTQEQVKKENEIFCQRCAWHGTYDQIK